MKKHRYLSFVLLILFGVITTSSQVTAVSNQEQNTLILQGFVCKNTPANREASDTIIVSFEDDETVGQLKERVLKSTGIPVQDFVAANDRSQVPSSFLDTQLVRDMAKKGNTFRVLPKNAVRLQTMMSDNYVNVVYSPQDTISNLKKLVVTVFSFSADIRQKWIFKKQPLDDTKTLADYNIQPGSTISLILQKSPEMDSKQAISPSSGTAAAPADTGASK